MDIQDNVRYIVDLLLEKELTVATAESCTGGGIASAITDIAGSSGCFGFGIVSYSNQAKEKLLLVPKEILAEYGAVSEQTAAAMAKGLQSLSGADIVISVTGIAGPTGATIAKPVGLVYVAIADEKKIEIVKNNFFGDRKSIRKQTIDKALTMLVNNLEGR